MPPFSEGRTPRPPLIPVSCGFIGMRRRFRNRAPQGARPMGPSRRQRAGRPQAPVAVGEAPWRGREKTFGRTSAHAPLPHSPDASPPRTADAPNHGETGRSCRHGRPRKALSHGWRALDEEVFPGPAAPRPSDGPGNGDVPTDQTDRTGCHRRHTAAGARSDRNRPSLPAGLNAGARTAPPAPHRPTPSVPRVTERRRTCDAHHCAESASRRTPFDDSACSPHREQGPLKRAVDVSTMARQRKHAPTTSCEATSCLRDDPGIPRVPAHDKEQTYGCAEQCHR